MTEPITPTGAQLLAIEAEPGPVLVVAGPGAGKTFCLTERIRHLIASRGASPERICALTFTNKAAEEIAHRLARDLGDAAELITRSTIHSLCVRILRAHGGHAGLERGFGIADEDYQKDVLRRFGVPPKWSGATLNRFSASRLGVRELPDRDQSLYRRYRSYLARRRMIDFDDLIHLTDRLFREHPAVAAEVAAQWDHVLVDEFQDLNALQYAVVETLARGHRSVFVVGDDEQSIFSWTGADPALILRFANDFGAARRIVLDQNRRTAREIFAPARRLLSANPTLFAKDLVAVRSTDHPVLVKHFDTDDEETAWLVADLIADREASGHEWGDCAILYRKHAVGDVLEGALLQAGIPVRLAVGRAITDDPVVRYLIAALKVIAYVGDPVVNEAFVREVLPASIVERCRKQGEYEKTGTMPVLRRTARALPLTDPDGRKMRRALAALNNLGALGQRHTRVSALIEEVLSQRVGPYQTVLEDRADELSDPADHPAAVELARELGRVREAHGRVLLPPMGGVEIGIAGILQAAGFRLVHYLNEGIEPGPDDLVIDARRSGSLGLPLTVFKALQVVNAAGQAAAADFTVVDLETTDRDVKTAEIVEIAAVRVRNWEIVGEFRRLVRPRAPMSPRAEQVHGYTMEQLAAEPYFEDVWPQFAAFAGDDELVAHNGYSFDFPILARMSGHRHLRTYDTLPLARSLRLGGSARLEHLAERFGVDPGRSHEALSDVRTLAGVFRHLERERLARSRRVGLANALDHLGVALALSDPGSLSAEGLWLRETGAVYALGRFTTCLDFYRAERDRAGPATVPVDELIEKLGGTALMLRVRSEKDASQRYPDAMARVRRLVELVDEEDLGAEIREFLGRVALSRSDGIDNHSARVSLLTLHATKGLEFSRVWIVGVEDAELPGARAGTEPRPEDLEEARRLLYVGMTRARDRLVMTRVGMRGGVPTGGVRFLEEMNLT